MPAIRKIILIRHGEIEPEYQFRYIGVTDPGLSRDGIETVTALRGREELLEHGDVFVSPMRRTVASAKLIFGEDAELKIEPRLRETDFGEWENLTFAEIERLAEPHKLSIWCHAPENMSFPGGESLRDVASRVDEFMTELVASNPVKPPVLVTHGGVLNYLLCKWLRLPMQRQAEIRMPRGTMRIFEGEIW